MSKFEESKFYKSLQDFFINNNKDTFLQMLGEFYNRTENIINKNVEQDEIIKELRELFIKFNENGIDENTVKEKVNYFIENSAKIKNINSQLDIMDNKKANETDLKVLSESMNQFTSLPQGSTTGDAELIDGRAGVDGVTYANIGTAIRTQIKNANQSIDRISELSEFFKREQINLYNFLHNCKKGKIVKSEGLNSNNCNKIFFSPNKNLCLLTGEIEYNKPLKTSNNATVTFFEDGTIEYQEVETGTPAFNDIWSNNVADTKFPFDVEISCLFNVSKGGFVVYVYGFYENGQEFVKNFVNTREVIPKNSTIKRVYFKSNNLGSRYSFKVKINKADELATFEPLLAKRVDIAELNNLELSEGTNFFMPIYKNGYVTNYLTYAIKNSDIVNLQNDLNELKTKVVNGVNIIEVDEVNKTIQDALIEYTDEKIIHLHPNKYVTQIDGRNTGKKIIGYDKDLCIIYDNSGNYDTPPIELAYGMLKNLTVIEENNTIISHKAYALHIDSNVTENKEIIIENCKFKANLIHAVGIGTRAGANITFKNCEFETIENDFVFYLHNTESVGTNICKFIFDSCVFKGEQKTLKLQDWRGCNKIDFTFINNTFYSENLTNEDSVEIQYRNYSTDSEITKLFKNSFTLNKMSHGNNVSFLNA